MTFKTNLIQGDDATLSITAVDKANNIISLVGASSITFKMKDCINCNMILEKDLSNSVTITDAANGVFEVDFIPSDTNDITPGKYFFEVEIIDSENKTSTLRDIDDTLGVITLLADLDN